MRDTKDWGLTCSIANMALALAVLVLSSYVSCTLYVLLNAPVCEVSNSVRAGVWIAFTASTLCCVFILAFPMLHSLYLAIVNEINREGGDVQTAEEGPGGEPQPLFIVVGTRDYATADPYVPEEATEAPSVRPPE